MNGFCVGEMKSLDEALKSEIERVQRLVDRYGAIPECKVTTLAMQADIATAKELLRGNDVSEMLKAYESLCGWGNRPAPVEKTTYCTPWLSGRFNERK